MTLRDCAQILESNRCPACQRPKVANTAFCTRCYFSLPQPVRTKVWRKFGEGFEEAYDKALEMLAGKERARTA